MIDWSSSYVPQEVLVYALIDGDWRVQASLSEPDNERDTVSLDVTTSRIYLSLRQPAGPYFGIYELIVR